MRQPQQRWKLIVLAGVAFLAAAVGPAVGQALRQQPAPEPRQQPGREQIDAATCFGCHGEVDQLWQKSPHASLDCNTCHGDVQAHLQEPTNHPRTSLEPETCGECHEPQYRSSMLVNWASEARQEKGVPGGRSPLQDKLLAPHGFTIEHNEPRSHPFMVVDQLSVDRFASGRYQFKDAWGVTRPGKTWEVLEDTGEPISGLASAGNATCLQCKTSDLILDWKFMGDPSPDARWSRTSDVNELIKAVHNPVGCIHCHDPHGARPRVVRDALIEAVQRDGATPYADDKGKQALQVVDFRDFRKIGLLPEADSNSNLLCAQCHVEYNCNAGLLPEGEGKVGYDSRLTNHFPWKNVLDLLDHYDQVGFRDFRHAVTGARLIKLQHPETETFWQSPHDRAGVKCVDCHLGKISEGGEEYTNHAMLRPRHNVEGTCLNCHPDSSPEELLYQVDAVQNYTRGKIRKAEYQLSVLIDTYEEAVRQGVPEATLAQARKQHEIAHVLWEWWTAENSDGWHNPDLARRSLLQSQIEARKGAELLQAAMKGKAKPAVIK